MQRTLGADLYGGVSLLGTLATEGGDCTLGACAPQFRHHALSATLPEQGDLIKGFAEQQPRQRIADHGLVVDEVDNGDAECLYCVCGHGRSIRQPGRLGQAVQALGWPPRAVTWAVRA